jgi:glycosyltransferase involved in cell wall biosynthesis
VDDIAHAILRVLSDSALRTRLIERGLDRAAEFSWRRAAEESLRVYEMAARRGRRAE